VSKSVENLKVAFKTLNQNTIMQHSKEINELTIPNLKERYPAVYQAIEKREYRRALVLTGLFAVSSKGRSEDYEIEYSEEAEAIKINPVFRFRGVFVGRYVWHESKPEEWKFDPNNIMDTRFDSYQPIRQFIESLYLLIALDEDGKPAWQKIEDWNNDIISWATAPRTGFAYICKNILEKDLRKNEKEIRKLIQ
jgi:hypothetical protein